MGSGNVRDVDGLERGDLAVGEVIGSGREGQIKWIQCATAARLLEVSRQRVYQLCRNGVLPSLMYDGRRYVSVRGVNQRVLEMAKQEET